MESNNDEFKDLESTLRKALASEKQTGLSPQQLNSLHLAIEKGNKAAPGKRRSWWHWSLAGSILATAMVAFIVVNRFPGQEGPATETAAPWVETRPAEKQDVAKSGLRPPAPAKDAQPSDTQVAIREKKPTTASPTIKKKSTADFDDGAMKSQKSRRKRPELKKNMENIAATPAKPAAGPAVSSTPALSPKKLQSWESGGKKNKGGIAEGEKAEVAKTSTGAAKPATKPGFASGGAGYGGAASSGMASSLQNAPKNNAKVSVDSAPGIAVVIVDIKSTGDPDSLKKVKAVINANSVQLAACNQAQGKIGLKWTITAQGRTESVQITSGSPTDKKTGTCITDKIKRWIFPKTNPAVIESTFRFGKSQH